MIKSFPNNFDNWHETHYEIVAYLTETLDNEELMSSKTQSTQGQGGLYELAKSLTDEFELKYKGVDWDGDFYDTLDEFLRNKENETI
jgi:type VI protein secretion system component Hcp